MAVQTAEQVGEPTLGDDHVGIHEAERVAACVRRAEFVRPSETEIRLGPDQPEPSCCSGEQVGGAVTGHRVFVVDDDHLGSDLLQEERRRKRFEAVEDDRSGSVGDDDDRDAW